jgi:hypothetical protein
VRRNIIKKEKEIDIHNKTQKAFKARDFNNKLFLNKNIDKTKGTHIIRINTINDDKNIFVNSKKNLKSQTINNNSSEKKRIMLIKQKIIEKQNNIFLLDFGDIGYKIKFLILRKNYYLNNLQINLFLLIKEYQ